MYKTMNKQPQTKQLTDEETQILWKRDGVRLSRNNEELFTSEVKEMDENMSYVATSELSNVVANHIHELYQLANLVGEECEELEVEEIIKSYQLHADMISSQYMEDMEADMSSFLETFKQKWEELVAEKKLLEEKNKFYSKEIVRFTKDLKGQRKSMDKLEKRLKEGSSYYRDMAITFVVTGFVVGWTAMNNYLCFN